MKYFSLYELISALFYSVGFGVAFGIVASAFAIIFDNLAYFVKVPYRAFLLADKPGSWRSFFEKSVTSGGQSRVLVAIRDFVFTLLFGVSFVFLVYLASDGIPRFYILVTAILATAFSYRVLGVYARRLFGWLFTKIFALTSLIFALFFCLPKKLFMRFGLLLLRRCKGIFLNVRQTVYTRINNTSRKKGK